MYEQENKKDNSIFILLQYISYNFYGILNLQISTVLLRKCKEKKTVCI